MWSVTLKQCLYYKHVGYLQVSEVYVVPQTVVVELKQPVLICNVSVREQIIQNIMDVVVYFYFLVFICALWLAGIGLLLWKIHTGYTNKKTKKSCRIYFVLFTTTSMFINGCASLISHIPSTSHFMDWLTQGDVDILTLTAIFSRKYWTRLIFKIVRPDSFWTALSGQIHFSHTTDRTML